MFDLNGIGLNIETFNVKHFLFNSFKEKNDDQTVFARNKPSRSAKRLSTRPVSVVGMIENLMDSWTVIPIRDSQSQSVVHVVEWVVFSISVEPTVSPTKPVPKPRSVSQDRKPRISVHSTTSRESRDIEEENLQLRKQVESQRKQLTNLQMGKRSGQTKHSSDRWTV